MSTKSLPTRSFISPRRRAFTFIELLLVLAIIALFILCIAGFFLSRNVEPLKPPPRKPAPVKTAPASVLPAPVPPTEPEQPPEDATPAPPAPAPPAEPEP